MLCTNCYINTGYTGCNCSKKEYIVNALENLRDGKVLTLNLIKSLYMDISPNYIVATYDDYILIDNHSGSCIKISYNEIESIEFHEEDI